MTYLLDVNALIALGFAQHEFHDRVGRWVRTLPEEATLATTPITELGFVRVLAQLGNYNIAVSDAQALLLALKKLRRPSFRLIPDDQSVTVLPRWVKVAKQTTDGHLLQLARHNKAKLATLDKGIPGGFLIDSES